jgi:hypothetical protein
VAYTCNPSYSGVEGGGRDEEDCGSIVQGKL